MNYYPFHIGDFRSGTVNMSRQARWIYRDLLDIYYDTEKPLALDLDKLCDEVGAESDEERRIVERLLRFKFTKTDDGYHHAICDQVITDYHAKAETAKTNGKKGGRPKKADGSEAKPSGLPIGSDPVSTGIPQPTGSQTNQEPRTNTTTPPIPPGGGQPGEQKRKAAVSLRSFLDDCRSSGATPIPEDDPVFAYADKVKLPRDFLRLQWVEFKERYQLPDAKKYKSWTTVFLKSVKGNWFKLWFVGADGQYALTTVGQQAQRSHQEAA